MNQNIRVRPVHVYLVPFVVCTISQLSSSVASSADAVLPGVESCAAAFGAEDWVGIIIQVCLHFFPWSCLRP